jgi:hypothetical protein
MGLSILYAVMLTAGIVAAFRASALVSLLFLLAVSVLGTIALAMLKYGEAFLWASLIIPLGVLLASLALTSALDRIARRSCHRS